jgi:hypothetical protein
MLISVTTASLDPQVRQRLIQLPRTSSRSQRRLAHLKLLSAVRPLEFSCAFEGRIYPPGGLLPEEKLGPCPVVLECVGPVGDARPGRLREVQWILWRYDWQRAEWREIARAQSRDASWTLALREPAIRAMNPKPELVDVLRKGMDIATEIIESIDRRIEHSELEAVRPIVLDAVYNQVAARIAAA